MRIHRLPIAVVILAIFAPTLLNAQKTFDAQIDLSFFDDCETAVSVSIENSADNGTNALRIQCASDLDPAEKPRLKVQSQRQTLAITTDWADASNWRISTTKGWLNVEGIQLPGGAYKLTATSFKRFQSQASKLLEQPFIVNNTTGPSIRSFTIRRPSPFDAIKEKLLGRETLYISIIGILATLLGAALRKRAEKWLDQALDYLGSFGLGKLAERRFLKRYNDYLFSTHRYLRLLGFAAAGVSRPQLEQVFISLRVSPFDRKRDDQSSAERGVSFESATAQNRKLVILGGPGAGKTTTLSYIVLRILQGTAGELLGTSDRLLPIFVPLRRLSSKDTSLLDDILSADTQILPADILREVPKDFIERRLKQGKCVLLLDGLDEVIDETTHQLAAKKINRIVTDYPDNRFIVTCRIAGWRGLLDDFRIVEAEDFNPAEVHRFVFGWHRAVVTQEVRNEIDLTYRDPEERAAGWQKRKAEVQNSVDSLSRRLINAVESSGRLMAVATNPMLLSLICLVHYVRSVLPRERPVLYEECIKLLIDAWERSKNIGAAITITASQREAVLRGIAMAFQTSGKSEAPRDKVEQIIAAEITKLGLPIQPQALLEQIEQRSGILMQRSIDVYGFSHLTLQEYLVAKHLQLNPSLLYHLWANLDNQEWREVTLLYAGLIDEATELIGRITDRETDARWLLAGYSLGEARHCEAELARSIMDRLTTEFEAAPLGSEILLNVLAAMCLDYATDPVTPEQKLSAQMIRHVEQRTTCARAAIQILGKGRITKAIPAIVAILGTGGELEEEVVKSLVLFGNIALAPMIESFRIVTASRSSSVSLLGVTIVSSESSTVTSRVSLDLIIRILTQLDTPEAAMELVKALDQWPAADSQLAISSALSAMLENQHIVTALMQMNESDVPGGVEKSFRLETIIWPFHDGEATPFDRLALKIRDDLRTNVLEPMCGEGFKLRFSAIALYLATRTQALSRDEWTVLGFSVASDVDFAVLNRLHQGIRSGQTDVKEGIRRALRGSAIKEASKLTRSINNAIEIFLALLTATNLGLSAFVCWNLGMSAWASEPVGMTLLYAILPIWLLCIAYAIYTAPGRRWLAILSPAGQFLRRTPYLAPLGSWLNFAVIQLIWITFSFPTATFIHEFQKFDDLLLLSWDLIFLLLCCWFYKFKVLRVDAPALLLLKHPLGRKAAGLPPEPDSRKSAAPIPAPDAQSEPISVTTNP